MSKKGFGISALTMALHISMLSLSMSALSKNAMAAEMQSRSYDIPAGRLSRVLNQFAVESGAQIAVNTIQLEGIQSQGLKGQFNVLQGFQQILKNSGYDIAQAGMGYVLIKKDQVTPRHSTLEETNILRESHDHSIQRADSGLIRLPVIQVFAEDNKTSKDWAYQQQRAVSVIDRSDIDSRPVLHIADILQDTPGVYSAVNRLDPALSVNIRGIQDFGRVNMMIDGMRQNHVESGHQQRNGQMYVDSEFISHVVVEKGPRADVHGASAIAGSANFNTLDFDDVILPDKNIGVRIRGSTGLGDKYDGNIRFKGSTAVAANLGENDQLQLLYARAYNKQGDTRVGAKEQNSNISGWNADIVNQTGEPISVLKNGGLKQESNLFKAKYNFSDYQNLQFSYIDTEYSYNNLSDQMDGLALLPTGGELWKKNGESNTKTQSYALDYNYNDNELLNLNAKIYYVDTKTQETSYSKRNNQMSETYWQYGLCPSTSSSLADTCALGMDRASEVSTKTIGAQLNNSSYFNILDIPGFSANYGFEYFRDKAESPAGDLSRDGISYGKEGSDIFNGDGKRDVGSIFGSLNYNQDGHSLSAGLRYDYYKLKGSTILTTHDMERVKVPNYNDVWVWQRSVSQQPLHVKKDWKKLLPSVSGSIQVLDGLNIFTSWGESWRPPAITETLFQGGHAGDSFAKMYPNPYLKPEYSESFEIGLNYNKKGWFKPNDKLNVKLNYYNTEVENYTVTYVAALLPNTITGLGQSMFVQNQVKTPFKGVELDFSYDAESWYTKLNYNHVIGGDNKFCLMQYPLGSGFPDEYGYIGDPNALKKAQDAGFDLVRDYYDSIQNCTIGNPGILNSARNMPTDKGSFILGARLFEQKLDLGLRVNYSEKGGARYTYNNDESKRVNGILNVGSNKIEGSEVWKNTTIYNLYANYKVNKNLTFNFAVENFRDTNYFANYSDGLALTYAPGRTFIGGMEFRF